MGGEIAARQPRDGRLKQARQCCMATEAHEPEDCNGRALERSEVGGQNTAEPVDWVFYRGHSQRVMQIIFAIDNPSRATPWARLPSP